MIKNRNIANDAGIEVTKIIGSDIGEVRYVCKQGTNSHAMLRSRVHPDMLYVCDGTADQVQINEAIVASKGGTNSYIYVFPGAYSLTEPITMRSRSSMHLLAANGKGFDTGAPGAALLQQTGNYEVVIMEAYGELAGFQIINLDGYSAVTIAANIWRPQIHNNCFHMVAGSAINIIDATGTAAASYGSISHNRFATWVGGNLTSAINVGTGTGVDIIGNTITQYNGTMDTGIAQAGAQCVVKDNTVSNCGGGGVVTVAVQLYAYSTAVGNRLSVDAGKALAGGTAANSFVDNMDGATGAGNGAASNLET